MSDHVHPPLSPQLRQLIAGGRKHLIRQFILGRRRTRAAIRSGAARPATLAGPYSVPHGLLDVLAERAGPKPTRAIRQDPSRGDRAIVEAAAEQPTTPLSKWRSPWLLLRQRSGQVDVKHAVHLALLGVGRVARIDHRDNDALTCANDRQPGVTGAGNPDEDPRMPTARADRRWLQERITALLAAIARILLSILRGGDPIAVERPRLVTAPGTEAATALERESTVTRRSLVSFVHRERRDRNGDNLVALQADDLAIASVALRYRGPHRPPVATR